MIISVKQQLLTKSHVYTITTICNSKQCHQNVQCSLSLILFQLNYNHLSLSLKCSYPYHTKYVFTGVAVTVGVSMYVLSISRLSEVDMVIQYFRKGTITITIYIELLSYLYTYPFTYVIFIIILLHTSLSLLLLLFQVIFSKLPCFNKISFA